MKFVTDRKALSRFSRWAIRVSELMRPDPPSIRADDTVREAISLLAAKEITAAPVINEVGRPIGVLSLSDVVARIRDQGSDRGAVFDMQTRELMSPFVLFVDFDVPVYVAVDELLDCQVRQMYVADKDGVLVGVLSTTDLLDDLRRHADEHCGDQCTIAP